MAKKCTFIGGIHPPLQKSRTEKLAVDTFPLPDRVVIPLIQHLGEPAQPLVKRGDHVTAGQVIGEAGNTRSAIIHASISGTVLSIGQFVHPAGKQVTSVEIESDGFSDVTNRMLPISSWRDAAPQELVRSIQNAGIVGMGGVGIPTHVKLSPPVNKTIETVIINAAESEPYLTADGALIAERTEQFLESVLILRKIAGAKRTIIGIDATKNTIVKQLSGMLADARFKEITLCKLEPKYPQGDERMLIAAVTGLEVPSGASPVDIGCVVVNVATAFAIHDAIITGMPLIERVVTVTGKAVTSPQHLRVRIGTPVEALLTACGADISKVKKVIMGGPMTGCALSDLSVPVIKTTTALVLLDNEVPALKKYPCINCGHCVQVCPYRLIPSHIVRKIEKGDFDAAKEWQLLDCSECGACSYVCPAKINLVHWIKLGKYHLNAQGKSAAASRRNGQAQ